MVLEEADQWAPQSARSKHDKVVFTEVEMIGRRGRSKGFRLITVTQRPQSLHKSILSQVGTLVSFALPGTRDRRAVFDYLEAVTTDGDAVYKSLP